jgi:hypothetical protein
MAAPIESEKMKTDLVRPDGTLPPNAAPPQANINGAPLPAPQSPAAAEAPRAKAVSRVAKALKPATARHLGGHGQPRQIANKAKGTPVSSLTTEPAPIAHPKAEAPTNQPSPASNGTFGFVQSAVNSLTSATAKLLYRRSAAAVPPTGAPLPTADAAPPPNLSVAPASPASMSCDELWHERNAVYARNGYCFKTQKAISTFGKSCFPPYGGLQGPEKNHVTEIRIWEQQKGCRLRAL